MVPSHPLPPALPALPYRRQGSAFESGGEVQRLVAYGVLHPGCAEAFRVGGRHRSSGGRLRGARYGEAVADCVTVRVFGRTEGWTQPYISLRIGSLLIKLKDAEALPDLTCASTTPSARLSTSRGRGRGATSGEALHAAGASTVAGRVDQRQGRPESAVLTRCRLGRGRPGGTRPCGSLAAIPHWSGDPGPRPVGRRRPSSSAPHPGPRRAPPLERAVMPVGSLRGEGRMSTRAIGSAASAPPFRPGCGASMGRLR
jgi:hypothetical protein